MSKQTKALAKVREDAGTILNLLYQLFGEHDALIEVRDGTMMCEGVRWFDAPMLDYDNLIMDGELTVEKHAKHHRIYARLLVSSMLSGEDLMFGFSASDAEGFIREFRLGLERSAMKWHRKLARGAKQRDEKLMMVAALDKSLTIIGR